MEIEMSPLLQGMGEGVIGAGTPGVLSSEQVSSTEEGGTELRGDANQPLVTCLPSFLVEEGSMLMAWSVGEDLTVKLLRFVCFWFHSPFLR